MVEDYYLDIGWKTDNEFHPIIAKTPSGKLSKKNLFRIKSKLIAKHTAIIAQSGSGKSYFLGRLIEEIVLKTKCNCMIFDPNADFNKIYNLVDKENWEDISYSYDNSLGKLPTEKSQKSFKPLWNKITKKVLSADPINSNSLYQDKITLWWPSVNIDLISSQLTDFDRTQVINCHNLFKIIVMLYGKNLINNPENKDVFDLFKDIFNKSKEKDTAEFYLYLDDKVINFNNFPPLSDTERIFNALSRSYDSFSSSKIREEIINITSYIPKDTAVRLTFLKSKLTI